MTKPRAAALKMGIALASASCAALGACSSFSDDSAPPVVVDAGADGTPDGAPLVDARAESSTPACDRGKPFGLPAAPLGVNQPDVSVYAPRLTPDELTLYTTHRLAGNATARVALYVASRPSRSDPFGASTEVAGLDQLGSNNADSVLAPDGLSLFFGSDRASAVEQVFVARRSSTSGTFASPVPFFSSGPRRRQPWPTFDGTELWLTEVTVPDGGAAGSQFRIAKAPLGSDGGASGPPVTVPLAPAVADEARSDAAAVLTGDGLTIFFTSLRIGGAGGFDIWTAERSSTVAQFGVPTLVKELSGTYDEFPGWVSPDGCRLYFATDRTSPTLRYEVYVAERPALRP